MKTIQMDDGLQLEQVKESGRPFAAFLILTFGIALLIFAIALSISYGAADIALVDVWQGIFFYDSTFVPHQVIQELRLPRALAAALTGSFLAVSGAIMQGMTRNPLASPSIMGVTAGASFAIAVAFVFFPSSSYTDLLMWSFAGAGLGVSIVFGVGSLSKGGLTPVKLALAGTAVTALLGSFSTALAIRFEIAQDLAFWFAGGVAGAGWVSVKMLIPVAIGGLIAAIVMSRSITVLSLGDDVAKGLGQRTGFVKLIGTVIVLLLTGAAVAVAGAIGFVGLVIPHITRFLVGVDYRWIIPCSAVLGGLLLVLADLAARMINPPYETPVGALTALIGVPFFLYLARKEGRGM
jgi:iron complex transport system permease protein